MLIVEDDETIARALFRFLERSGHRPRVVGSVEGALGILGGEGADLVLADHKLPDGTALDLLSFLRGEGLETPVIVLTGHATISLAVRAMRAGAENFLAKPVDLESLGVVIERCLDRQKERRRLRARRRARVGRRRDPFAGSSPAIRRLEEEARRLLATDRPILLLGETGAGKGVLARWLHEESSRRDGPWVEVNCATLSSELLESELFGHEKGAFTGAVQRKEGLFEVADTGTIFLDEIGDIPLPVQPRILKVIEDRTFRRIGDVRDRRVDVRILAATHHDLPTMVREGRFRRDLYFRVGALPVEIPSLRERLEDLPVLCSAILETLVAELAKPLELGEGVLGALASYDWPGNLRELANVLERAAILTRGSRIGVEDLRFETRLGPREERGERRVPRSLADVEALHIRRTLESCDWHVPTAAELLEVPRSSLYKKIERLGLKRGGGRI